MAILIVESSPEGRDRLTSLLGAEGYTEVVTAESARHAFQYLGLEDPAQATRDVDLILLDIGLPDMEGYEVARRLRRVPKLATVRLIAVSGYDTPEARSRSVEAGFDYHLGKPVDLSALETLIAT